MHEPKVFIIVLHYKSWDDTNECLASLKNLNYHNFEVRIIDNDKKNSGFAGGNNSGIKYALEHDADYILLLNNDTIVEKNFLKKLIKAGEDDKKTGILGPKIYFHKLKKIWFVGGRINRLYTKGIHISTISTKRSDQPSTVNEVDYITGCCLLVKKEVVEKIGLMDEDYFLYFEDVDWCLKARRAGYKCLIVPESKIWHKVSSSAIEGSFSYIYYHTRNGFLLAKKNAPFFIKILAYFVSFLVYIKQLIKSPSKWTKAIKLGIRDFYRGKFGKLNK